MVDQAQAILTFVDAFAEKTLSSTVMLTAAVAVVNPPLWDWLLQPSPSPSGYVRGAQTFSSDSVHTIL